MDLRALNHYCISLQVWLQNIRKAPQVDDLNEEQVLTEVVTTRGKKIQVSKIFLPIVVVQLSNLFTWHLSLFVEIHRQSSVKKLVRHV